MISSVILDTREEHLVSSAESVERDGNVRVRESQERSFRMTIRVSTSSRWSSRRNRPHGGCPQRRRDEVTTPTVRAPASRAILATTGAAPVPVPTALASGHEHHIRTLKRGGDLVDGDPPQPYGRQ